MSQYRPIAKPHKHGASCNHDHGHQQKPAEPETPKTGRANPPGAKKLKLTLTAMDCPTEAAMIKKAFAEHRQIHQLDFDLINRILTVTHTLTDQQEIHRTLIGIGLLEDPVNATTRSAKTQWLLLGASGLLATMAELLDWSGANSILIATSALLAIALCGTGTLKKGWHALRHFQLNINLLMSIAVTGAVLIGQFPEAAMVIFLFSCAEKIEAASLGRARNAITALQAHAPESAWILQSDGSWREMPSEEIQTGQTARARAGDRIALDGIVIRGESSVNQALITGESMPVAKNCGDVVYAGTLNQEGVLEYQITSTAASSTLERIAQAIQQAQQQRAPTERIIDRFAQIYTPAVFGTALLIAILPPLFMHASWHAGIYQALVMLVIACPCALVISTPVTVVSALTSAAQRGIVIKGGRFLEQAHLLDTIAFDKTGTLTEGRPALQNTVALANTEAAQCLNIAASLNHLSQHPLAMAMLAAAQDQQLQKVAQFQSLTGLGVRGAIDGVTYVLGNVRLMQESGVILTAASEQKINALEMRGHSIVLLGQSAMPALAAFSFADQVRADSQGTIAELQAMGIRCVMLTGDNLVTAQAVAQQVGISTIHAGLLPEDKLQLITALQKQGKVAMVGDGVNDAPALATADIGITPGAAASATALDTADIALMQNNLGRLPELIRLSKRCSRILKQNISIALLIKAVFMVLTLFGHANLWMAVFADMGASLIVIFNGLRLLK